MCKHEGQKRFSVTLLYHCSPYCFEIKSLTDPDWSYPRHLASCDLSVLENLQAEMEMWLSGEALGWHTLAFRFDSYHTGRQGEGKK